MPGFQASLRLALVFGIGVAVGAGLVAMLRDAAVLRDPGLLSRMADAMPPVAASGWGQHVPRATDAGQPHQGNQGTLRPNVPTDFNPDVDLPEVHETAYIDPQANVAGDVRIGKLVYVAPFASVRGDEGQPIHIGDASNVQDGVVIHGLETFSHGEHLAQNVYRVHGRPYSVYIGDKVSLAHQSHVHGPAWIEDKVFVGMQSMIFKAHIGSGVVIEPGTKIIGVDVPEGRYVPAGSIITTQEQANALPLITYSYAFKDLNREVVRVNTALAEGYAGRSLPARTLR